jgi:membrane protein
MRRLERDQQRLGARRRPASAGRSRSAAATLRATIKQYSTDNLGDRAAALTYYGVLAMFPALIALVGLVGLVANPAGTTRTLTTIITQIGVASSAKTFAGPIHSITAHRATAGIVGLLGLVGALWSASGYIGAFMRASNVIYETPEGRPFWKRRPLQLLITFVMLFLLVVVALALVLTGPIVSIVAKPLGLGSTAISVWNIAKWPVLALIITGMFAVLFYASPNAKLAGLPWVIPGVVFAMAIWLIASALFALYVSQFSSYDKTYGTLAGVVVFLVWLWISNVALLLGMELNAERERNRELDEGTPGADDELQIEPRTPPKRQKTA